jgi:hypothetical protein
MIGSIVSGLSSLLSGGATGIIGSVVTNVADYFEKKRDQSHEIRLRELDIQEMEKEYEYRSEITAQETQAAAQQTSYDHDARSYSSGVQVKSFWLKAPLVWADVIRALIRPILTLGLVFLVYLIFQKAQAVLQESDLQALDPESALAIYSTIIDMILYMASTAVTWWFGTRPRKQQKA